MSVEETLPNKPNFALIVAIAVVVILAALAFAVFVLHWDGGHFMPHASKQHVTSQLEWPSTGQPVYSLSPM